MYKNRGHNMTEFFLNLARAFATPVITLFFCLSIGLLLFAAHNILIKDRVTGQTTRVTYSSFKEHSKTPTRQEATEPSRVQLLEEAKAVTEREIALEKRFDELSAKVMNEIDRFVSLSQGQARPNSARMKEYLRNTINHYVAVTKNPDEGWRFLQELAQAVSDLSADVEKRNIRDGGDLTQWQDFLRWFESSYDLAINQEAVALKQIQEKNKSKADEGFELLLYAGIAALAFFFAALTLAVLKIEMNTRAHNLVKKES